MTVKFRISDGQGTGSTACVTARNQLVVAPIEYSEAYTTKATVINTAYNLVGPQAGEQFVITDILLYADRSVGANDADIQLYESTGPDSTTESKTILDLELIKQFPLVMTGINIIVTAGRWVNVKTNDNNVSCTIMGYYVKQL